MAGVPDPLPFATKPVETATKTDVTNNSLHCLSSQDRKCYFELIIQLQHYVQYSIKIMSAISTIVAQLWDAVKKRAWIWLWKHCLNPDWQLTSPLSRLSITLPTPHGPCPLNVWAPIGGCAAGGRVCLCVNVCPEVPSSSSEWRRQAALVKMAIFRQEFQDFPGAALLSLTFTMSSSESIRVHFYSTVLPWTHIRSPMLRHLPKVYHFRHSSSVFIEFFISFDFCVYNSSLFYFFHIRFTSFLNW